MDTVDRSAGAAVDTGPGAVFVVGLAGRDRWGAVAASAGLVAGFTAVAATQSVAIAQSWGAHYWLFGGTAATVVCLLALLRRRQRVGMALAGLAVAAVAILVARSVELPAEPSPAMAVALAVLVGSAVRALPPLPAGAVAVAGLAVVVGSQLAARPPATGITAVTTLNGIAWLGCVAAGLLLRLRDTRARAAVEQVRRAERLELARELHDTVTHHLTGMLLQAQAAQVVAHKDPGRTVDALAGIEAAGSDALAAMRRVVGLLREAGDAPPAYPEPEPLAALVERFGRQGSKVELNMPEEGMSWPPEVTSTVYRIVQEALTNVARHAPRAGSVTVTVGHDDSGVTVEVVDDAPSVPARHLHRSGYGLVGMRERVETLGGALSAGPRPGAGWAVRANLPLPVRASR